MPAKFYKNADVLSRDRGYIIAKDSRSKLRNYYAMAFKENPIAPDAFRSFFNCLQDVKHNRYDLTNLPMYKYEQTFQMDRFMKDNPIPEDVVAFRCVKNAMEYQFNIGDTYGSSCYGLLSLNPDIVCPALCGTSAVAMQLKIPLHTPAAYLESFMGDKEDMFILKRGFRYRVIDKEYDEYNPKLCMLKVEVF